MASMAEMIHPVLLELVARQNETFSNDTATNGTSSSSPLTATRPPVYRVVGIILAISSGLFIGTSFVVKKVGLLKANVKYHEEAGEGYGYLKNGWWWTGMSIMIVGEICNFVAYAFVDAILVTPMGSISVVVATILSAIFLKERLSFVGKVGCFNCIIGSVVIVLNSPSDSSVATIQEMQRYVIAPGFLTYAGVIIVGCVFIAFWAGPRYGKKSMLVYLSICSLIGGLSVVATQGLGAAIVAQIGGTPQFNQWFLYVLLVFVIATLVTEIIFLNKALNIFNAALVTPTYYVFFTSATIVTSAILFQGFKGTTVEIITIVMGFLVICSGVILLQLSKSSKDVPDAAVFSGDLDQIRTVAEQEEPESEPKADAIRGTAGIIRSMSKLRFRKEAEEAKRVHEDRMEPIGENEQVEWDGLRRRKTIIQPGQPQLIRRKTIHPPLGLSHFPSHADDEDSDNESHNPENDHGIIPAFRRMTTVLRKPHKSSTSHTDGRVSDTGDHAGGVALSQMKTPYPQSTVHSDGASDLSTQPFPDFHHTNTFNLHHQDTEYKSPTIAQTTARSTISFDPAVSTPPVGSRVAPPIPSSPPLSHDASKRAFSFHHVLGGRRSASGTTNFSDDGRPTTAASNSSIGGRVLSSLRRSQGGRTEEERLGLVQGDVEHAEGGTGRSGSNPLATIDSRATAHSPDIAASDEEDELEEDSDDGLEGADLDDVGGYARVKRRDDDDDGAGFGRGRASGAAFV